MSIPAQIMTGVATAQASGKVDDLLGGEDAMHQVHTCPTCGNPFSIFTDVHKLVHIAVQLRDAITPDAKDTPVDERITLQPGTLVDLHTYGKNYTMLFVPVSTAMLFQVMGVGTSTALTLAAGWNVINLPDGTQFGLPLAAPGNVAILLRASNVMYGNAI